MSRYLNSKDSETAPTWQEFMVERATTSHPRTNTGNIIRFVVTELYRISELQQPPAMADLKTLQLGDPDVADYRVLLDALVEYVVANQWSVPLPEAGAAKLFWDYIFTGAPVPTGPPAPSTLPLLWPLVMLLRELGSPTSMSIFAIKFRVCKGIARFIHMMNEQPQKYLPDPGQNTALVEIFLGLNETDFTTNENYDARTFCSFLSYGFLFADNNPLREMWYLLYPWHDSEEDYSREESIAYFEKLGAGALTGTRVTSTYLSWLKHNASRERKLKSGVSEATPLLWCLRGPYIPFRDAFWEHIAVPLTVCWRGERMDSESFGHQSNILFIFGAALCGTWPEISRSRLVCARLVALDIATVVSQICYMSVTVAYPLAVFRMFLKFFGAWMNVHPTISGSLRDAIRPSVERIYLSTLDKIGLAAFTLPENASKVGIQNSEKYKRMAMSGVECWREFGSILGLVEADLRKEERDKKAKHSRIVGCSWKKCALFHRTSEWPMLSCSHCFEVQYCADSVCQKRDWHEDGHKLACSNSRDLK